MAKPDNLPEWDTTEVNLIEPDTNHKEQGWLAPGGVPEKPPFQTFNYWQNEVYKWLKEINTVGVLGYSSDVDYVANISYVVGSDGVMYIAKITNGPSSTVVDPVGDTTGTWEKDLKLLRAAISGLVPSLAADSDHDITLSEGYARSATDTENIILHSSYTKQIDAPWAPGDNSGGLFSGSVAADTTYHVFIIKKDSDGSVDFGFDTSVTAANIPAGYSEYRLVNSVITDSSGNLYGFHAKEIAGGALQITWLQTMLDRALSTIGTASRVNFAISVPYGREFIARLHALYQHTVTTHILIRPVYTTDVAPSQTDFTIGLIAAGSSVSNGSTFEIDTDTTQQIAYRAANTGAQLVLDTVGYIDRRVD